MQSLSFRQWKRAPVIKSPPFMTLHFQCEAHGYVL